MTVLAFSIVAATVLISAFVQGSTGMGFAMIVAPVVSFIDPTLIPVMLLVLMIPLNAYVAARERSAIDWHGVKWISVGRFAGTFAGLWILLIVNLHQLSLLIGWSTLIAAVAALLAPKFSPNRTALAAVGLITGVTETSTGVGGPPYALAYQHSPGPELRSTVAVCFLVGEVISLLVLALSGQVAGPTLVTTAMLLPFLVVGSFLSRYVHHRLDGPVLRYTVLGFAIVSGGLVIIQA
ncbi:sulfite exporter TauE/SafE family protein [Brevibacterium casei]|uniref:Probable membrane transporter protein n=2 Tax=Brevibacterium casei TaxID=33889 RepID=K9B1I7_9MICO|nr:sulfite exporter TauE/SafE family protein [Brevibacterium casei]NJE66842.1 sulfite exporter TauE/SafE family protein [Brevibacterium sp. LS14]EKU47655.1 putative permease [Brevibacterium casei S18]MCT1765065.1 sulfite exporter TauE/SafE family protein [Brevibacterium casei]MCT2182005.1 sulfite exporter TauE/SafE family protein [Brevibacterium casei]MDH5147133.1 sulfite exporter TauE/SafE family protein [Brevibacterium casei]